MLKYLELVIAVAAALLSGYIGYRAGTAQYKSYLTKEAQVVVKAEHKEAELKEIVITKYMILHDTVIQKIDPIIKEVEKEVEKPIYSQCIIPESGRLLLQSSIDEANAALTADGAVR